MYICIFPLTEGEAVQAVHLCFQSNNLQRLTQQNTYLYTSCAKQIARVWPLPCPLTWTADCVSLFLLLVWLFNILKGFSRFRLSHARAATVVSHAACTIWHSIL